MDSNTQGKSSTTHHLSTLAYCNTDNGKKHYGCNIDESARLQIDAVKLLTTAMPRMSAMLEQLQEIEGRSSMQLERLLEADKHATAVDEHATEVLEEVRGVQDRITSSIAEQELARTASDSKMEEWKQGMTREMAHTSRTLDDLRSDMVQIAQREAVRTVNNMFDHLRTTYSQSGQ